MQAHPNRQQATAQEQLQKHLLYNCLPMLAALLLLSWLSFGLPQPTWGLLLKVMLRANMLIQQEGTASFLLALMILVVQSICLLGAWILLIQGITREVKKLLALSSGQPVHASVPHMQAPPVAQQPAVASAGPNPFQNPNANPYMPPMPSSVSQPSLAAPTVLNPYAPTYQPVVDATRTAPPPPPPLHNPFESEDQAMLVDSADDMPTLLTTPQNIADIPTRLETPPSYEQTSNQKTSATGESKAAHTSPYNVEDLYAETIRRVPAREDSSEHNLVEESDSPLNEPLPDQTRARDKQKRTVTSIQRRSIVPPSPDTPEPSRIVEAASVPENRTGSEPGSKKNPYASIENDPLEATMIADRSKMHAARNTQESEPTPAKKVSPSPATSERFANRQKEKQAAALPLPSPAQNDPFAVIEEDPFAVQEDVFNVFEPENHKENDTGNYTESYEEEAQEEEEQASAEDDPVFVFGNPFEGPLPDVFMEDEDLKRSVREQQEELSGDESSRASAAKKATGIRKRSK
jgi:hypothetical protein